MSRRVALVAIGTALLVVCATETTVVAMEALRTRYDKLLPLAPDEGVFAYSRVSPDGHFLSYASERHEGNRVITLVNFVDLRTKKVLHTEPGFDSYWSPDAARVIYLSMPNADEMEVKIWHRQTGEVSRNVVPADLGAYFTWGVDKGRDVVLTQYNHYYYLSGDKALRPYFKVLPCPVIGTGEQPMISRDGRRAATFFDGTLVVRSVEGCDTVLQTHLKGGKADFSFDNRYIAFHVLKDEGTGYRIVVVDLKDMRVIPVTDLEGSSLYPSWTKDGRLSFRYDSPKYRGFMMASNFLGNPSEPLPEHVGSEGQRTGTLKALCRTETPDTRVVLVNFWATWCVHCRNEMPKLDELRQVLRKGHLDAEIVGACEPSSLGEDREHVVKAEHVSLPQVAITPADLSTFGIQMFPTSLLFVDGKLVDRHTGAMGYEDLVRWLAGVGVKVSERNH